MAESSATGAGDVVIIDTSTLARPRPGLAGQAGFYAKAIGVFLAGMVATLAWMFIVIMATVKVTEAARGALEVVLALIGLAIAAVPLVLFAGLLVRYRNRHFAGVGSLIALSDFSEAELGREIPYLGVPLRAVIERVGALARNVGDAPPPFKETDPAKLRKARNTRLGLFAAFVGGLALYAATESWSALLPVGVAVVGYPWILMQARQAVQPSLDQLRAHDKRKPVLLLRSFQDDVIQVFHRIPTRIGDMLQIRRFEQEIAGMLAAFGPVIAVGKPGEELPQIGAARAYLSEGEWQPAVMRWMDEAVFIAMVAGATEWIRWELSRILEMGRVRHLIILVPPMPGKRNWEMPTTTSTEERWNNVLGALAATRWAPALDTLETRGLLLVLLRPDGRVVAIRREGKDPPWADDYQIAVAIAIYDEFCRAAA